MRAGHDVPDDLGVGWIRQRRLENAHHRCDARIEANGLADDRRIAVERSAPEAIGQHHGGRRGGSIVCRAQQAAEHGAKAHDVEVRAVDDARLDRARLAEAVHREVDGGEVAERVDPGRARLEVVDLRHRERRVLGAKAGRALADVDQAIFVAIDERTEEHLADDAEDRGVGADAERERYHHGEGQTLGAQERAPREPDVAPQCPGEVEQAGTPDHPRRLALDWIVVVGSHALLLVRQSGAHWPGYRRDLELRKDRASDAPQSNYLDPGVFGGRACFSA